MFWADWWADFRDDAFGEAANHFFFFGADLALSLSSMMVLATARATATAPHGFAPCFAGDPSNRRHVRFGQIRQTDSMGVTHRVGMSGRILDLTVIGGRSDGLDCDDAVCPFRRDSQGGCMLVGHRTCARRLCVLRVVSTRPVTGV